MLRRQHACPQRQSSTCCLPVLHSSDGKQRNIPSFLEADDLASTLPALIHAHKLGSHISYVELRQILRTCARQGDLCVARKVLSLTLGCGISSSNYLENDFLRIFGSFGCLLESNIIFRAIVKPNRRAWHALISVHAAAGYDHCAMELCYAMLKRGVTPDKYCYTCMLNICSRLEDLDHGKFVHEHLCSSGIDIDDFIRSSLIYMYGKCGDLERASEVFEGSPDKSVVVWTSMIAVFVQHGHDTSALMHFERMKYAGVSANEVTFLYLLKASGNAGAVGEGRHLHNLVIVEEFESNLSITNILIYMYCSFGHMEEALRIFHVLKNKSIVSWGAILAGYVHFGDGHSALYLFDEMKRKCMKANDTIYVCTLQACGMIGDLCKGRCLHNEIIIFGCESNVLVGSTLVDMYARCASITEACKTFEKLPEKNAITWAAIIGGCAEQGHSDVSLELFERMQKQGVEPDRVSYLCVLKACTSLCFLRQGRVIHNQILKSGFDNDVKISNTIIDMYAKCNSLPDACKAFNVLSTKPASSWITMIACYTEMDCSIQSLTLFTEMQHEENVVIGKFALSCALKACGTIGALMQAREIHTRIVEYGLESDEVVRNSLVDMYAQCGHADEAHRLLHVSSQFNIVSWGALINGYCQDGNLLHASECIKEMERLGLQPNHIILTCLLNACCYNGQLQGGLQVFTSAYVIPCIEQYTTFVGLLGCIGCIEEANYYLKTIPCLPVSASWFSLLTACKMHGESETGWQSYIEASRFDPLYQYCMHACAIPL